MKWPAIWFGAIFWKDVSDKAPLVKDIESSLNESIDLTNYGEGLLSIRFIPIAVRTTNQIHEEEIKYSGHKKQISLHLKLEYDAVAGADEKSLLQLVAMLFLDSIDQYPKHRVKNFDWQGFKKDVTDLFEAEGLLAGEQS